MPTALPPPVLQPVPVPRCWLVKKNVRNCNTKEVEEARKANEKAQSDVVEANRKIQGDAVDANRKGQEAVDKANGDLQAKHSAELEQADAKVNEADARVRAIPPAPDTQAADEKVRAAELAVDDARTMNPMFRVAAAWQKIPAKDLTSEQFEQVKHWAVIALAGATALVTALAAVISELPARDGKSTKLNRMVRAWIARKRKPVYRDVPGPEVIKEVEVLRDVPGPIEYRDVPGPIEYRDVPGPERIVERIKEVPGPVEYRPAPGPIEYRDVPGPERIVTKTVEVVKEVPVPGPERIVTKWVPYDVATGMRIKADGTLGEVANLRSVQ